MLAAENWPTIVTLTVLAGTMLFFALGKFRSDSIAVCALLVLMLTGVLTPQEALSGFANPIILTIAGVFIVGGAIVRTGLANVISDSMLRLAGDNHKVLYMLIMFVTGLIGSLVSNTGTVAIMMPIVVSMAMSLNISPSRFLMPLAFMSSMGGMLTLIGNAPNMVVNEVYVKAGFPSLTLFSFFPIGVVCFAFGMLILAPATAWFLSRRKLDKSAASDSGLSLKELANKYHLAQHMCTLAVPEHSSMVGKSLLELALTGRFGVGIQEIRRGKGSRTKQIAPGPAEVIRGKDMLYCTGSREKVTPMADEFGLNFIHKADAEDLKDKYRFDSIGICELVLMASSRLVNQTVAESGLREQFGISLLGVQRADQYILENLKELVMQPGDALLVQGAWANIARLEQGSQHWVVVGKPLENARTDLLFDKIPFVTAVIVGMIVIMATGILPTVTAVMLAATALVAGRCFTNMGEVYATINWETVVMIACMLPIAIAMEKTGMIGVASQHMTALGKEYGPNAALALVYGVTSLLNIVISFTPLTLLVAPVALQIALDLGFSPLPFMFGVATAASMCFGSSFSTPSNALVVSAGRYTFFDYLKIGLPLQLLLGIIMIWALPLLFPF